MLDPERGSIIKFFNDVNPVKVYIKKVPENMAVPSMYFPIPISDGERDSFSSYTNDYQMFVKVFEENSQQAFDTAEKITESIKVLKNIIPIYNEDGVESGSFLRIDKVKSREIDEGVVQIEVNWKSRRMYKKEESGKMGKVNLNLNL